MYARLGEPITIDDMARSAMYSKFHFTRMFQQAIGVPPGRFLTSVRFREAERLLLSTSLSVTEIAERVGYSSLGTFSAKFKSTFGLSPSVYRDLAVYAEPVSGAPVSGAKLRKRP
ncbi:helix-turn-helix transcriptional regulator [Actinomadura alba]|uniref:Helix-turn-helix transcriptional regulator n=1 Tax=Actinomadura alba TaxID=406431 RepID=A0ABR7LRV0_9ACTN|nr:helix-turn-helix transcriptional regulator [Actinomadura alba]